MTPLIVACIPAYNEHKSIAETINKVTQYVEQVIVCDDGSKDGTGKIAQECGAMIIRNPTNRGKGAALTARAGMLYSPQNVGFLP